MKLDVVHTRTFHIELNESPRWSLTSCFLKLGSKFFFFFLQWSALQMAFPKKKKKKVGYYSTKNITDADFIPRPLSLFRYVTLIKAHVY